MKKFVNNPKDFVPEMLKGIALANPDTLRYVAEYNLIMRTDAPSAGKVSVIQGSGSGHEPAHEAGTYRVNKVKEGAAAVMHASAGSRRRWGSRAAQSCEGCAAQCTTSSSRSASRRKSRSTPSRSRMSSSSERKLEP